MRKVIISFFIFVLIFILGCGEFFEPDLSNKRVTLLAPADSTETPLSLITFWWDHLNDADWYHLQIVTPNFDYPVSLVLDTNITENMEVLKTRTALEYALFEVWNDFRWYIRRNEDLNSKVLIQALEIWIRLLAPFAPYLCEELWNIMDHETFVSVADWPDYDNTKVDVEAQETENLVKNVLEDTSNILQATKIVPKQIYYYSAAPWKWKIYLAALKKSESGNITINHLMKDLMKEPELKKVAGKLAKFAGGIVQEINRMPQDLKQKQLKVGVLDETELLKTAEKFFKKEFNVKLHIYIEDSSNIDDPQQKARFAKPYRPAIYIA